MQRITLNQCDAGWGRRLAPAQFGNYIVDAEQPRPFVVGGKSIAKIHTDFCESKFQVKVEEWWEKKV